MADKKVVGYLVAILITCLLMWNEQSNILTKISNDESVVIYNATGFLFLSSLLKMTVKKDGR